jgi:hypothetical protein
MNQTSFMFGAVAFAFLFYVTTRGDLPKWLGLLGLAGVAGGPVASGAPHHDAGLTLPSLPSLPHAGFA